MAEAEALKSAQADIYKGRFEAALENLRPVLEATPNHLEALYMSAVCCRYLRDFDKAFELLSQLKAIAPEFGRADQEEGHLYRARAEPERALKAYQRATRFNPALHASWTAQAELLQARGAQRPAAQARAHAENVLNLPKELISVSSLLHEGRLVKAEKACKAFLQKNRHHIEGMRLLADIAARLQALDEAEFLLETALELDPDNAQVRLDYGKILRKRHKFAAGLDQARHLLERDPDNPVFISNYAVESQMAGDVETALVMFDKVLEKLPGDHTTLMSRGHALKTVGRQDEAIESYRAAYRTKPDHGDAYWSLANLKTYRFTEDEMAQMRAQEQTEDITLQDRFHLCFALGKAYEDRADYETSFSYYERGNDLKRRQSNYRADHMEEELKAQAAVCTPALFERQAGKGHPAPDPIFIVGLPRAGSTLLEQILASHSQVDGTMELPNILALSHKLRKRQRITETSPYPSVLHEMDADALQELGRSYIEETRIHRGEAPFFTDKMPNNFRHIGLIALILPNAKIIDARREPMACCFSGFKQLFAEGQEFTYGLEQIGRYYRGYVELMRHWHEVLPGKILHVQYEDVVADLDGQVRRILNFCGLPFEEACVRFHETDRAVRTASSEQVRRPVYTEGVEQWRHFESWLEPLKEALGPALTDYRQ